MNAKIAELKRDFDNLGKPVQIVTAFDGFRGEAWDTTLSRLPRRCLLWRTFDELHQARVAFEEIEQRHRRWKQELSAINNRLRAADPDTADLEAWSRDHAKGYMLQLVIGNQAEQAKELAQNVERAEEKWHKQWDLYIGILQAQAQAEADEPQQGLAGIWSPVEERRRGLAEERAKFERG